MGRVSIPRFWIDLAGAGLPAMRSSGVHRSPRPRPRGKVKQAPEWFKVGIYASGDYGEDQIVIAGEPMTGFTLTAKTMTNMRCRK